MPRSKRLTVFVNDQEYAILQAVSPDDEALGRTVRRLAMDRATWLADRGHKQRGRVPQTEATACTHPTTQETGDSWLDTSDSQT